MTTRTAFALLCSLALAGLGGCGILDDSTPPAPEIAYAQAQSDTSILARSSYVAAPDASELEAEMQGALYVVSPDRALVRVQVQTEGPTRAAAADRIRTLSQSVASRLSASQGCNAEVIDYATPRGGSESWTGEATVRLDVMLRGLTDVASRHARVEACMARFDALGSGLAGVDVRVSAPFITIDHPEGHRELLLRRALIGLEVVSQTEGPAAFDPDGMRCVSQGAVQITRRSLRGVALSVDLNCTPRPMPAALPAPSVPDQG